MISKEGFRRKSDLIERKITVGLQKRFTKIWQAETKIVNVYYTLKVFIPKIQSSLSVAVLLESVIGEYEILMMPPNAKRIDQHFEGICPKIHLDPG